MHSNSVNTTLCYIRGDDHTLMLQRAKADAMHGKWIAPGGKFEPGETPEECAVREVKEETGLMLNDLSLRGILTFVNHRTPPVIKTTTCFVYESFDFQGDLRKSAEGMLRWYPDSEIVALDSPKADKIFTPWIYEDRRIFSAKFNNGLQSVIFYG